MTARLIQLSTLSPEQVTAWRRLGARAMESNPFLEAEFVLAAALVAGIARMALLVVERDGEWLACMPVRPRGPRMLGALQTCTHRYCFLGTPLIDRDHVDEAVDGLVSAVPKQARFLIVPQVSGEGPIAASLESSVSSNDLGLVSQRRFDRACVVRAGGGRDLASKDRRRRLRRLQERVGEEVTMRERVDDRALDDFMRLEAAGWKGDAGTALASKADDAAFCRQMWDSFSDAGRTRMLELGGASSGPLAMYWEITGGDTRFAFKMAYDESYRAHSPGAELLSRAVEDFVENGRERLLDSCAASDNALANRLMPDRRSLASIALAPGGTIARFARPAASAATALRGRRPAVARAS